jgi:hypothetical protein
MMDIPIQRLQYLCDTIPLLLETIPEGEFSYKQMPSKWSKKEILGHLIDSATNNHHRIIRVQFEDSPPIFYDQDLWNNASRYNQVNTMRLITFWKNYNLHLIEIIKLLPKEFLMRECNIGENVNVTLKFIIEDYIIHLEHHLRQILDYE